MSSESSRVIQRTNHFADSHDNDVTLDKWVAKDSLLVHAF